MPKKILTETNSLIEKKASYYDLLRLKIIIADLVLLRVIDFKMA